MNEINIFDQLFVAPGGGGYPKDRVVPEQRNKKILDSVKTVTHTDIKYIVKNLDQDFVKETFSGEHFKEYFTRDAEEGELKDLVLSLC